MRRLELSNHSLLLCIAHINQSQNPEFSMNSGFFRFWSMVIMADSNELFYLAHRFQNEKNEG